MSACVADVVVIGGGVRQSVERELAPERAAGLSSRVARALVLVAPIVRGAVTMTLTKQRDLLDHRDDSALELAHAAPRPPLAKQASEWAFRFGGHVAQSIPPANRQPLPSR